MADPTPPLRDNHVTPIPGVGRGVLERERGLRIFDVERFRPRAGLARFVEHYWTVTWNLEGQPPFTQYTLPDPAVTLALEPGRSELVFVMAGRFQRVLEGRGRVFAAKFRPGGFWPFVGTTQSALIDRREPVDDHLPIAGADLQQRVFAATTSVAMAQVLDDAVAALPRRDDENVIVAQRALEVIEADAGLMNVATLAERTGHSVRKLQRLFDRYIGVTPKWTIQRVRLQEAAERLANGRIPLAALAQDLGFADQAHLTRAFKTLVGDSPGAYANRSGGERSERPKVL